MNQQQTNSVNFYEGYLARVKQEKGASKASKRAAVILPLALVTLALAAVAGKLLLDNRAKQEKLAVLDTQIEQLNNTFTDADTRSQRLGQVQEVYDTLLSNRVLFTLYPAPTHDVFTKVRACAAGIFNISKYQFDETSGVLRIDAAAPSVNEVPEFVQRLRDTALFSLVQYTGYTSDTAETYYCTVDCTLPMNTEGLPDAQD